MMDETMEHEEIPGIPVDLDTLKSLSVPTDPIPDIDDDDGEESYCEGLLPKYQLHLIAGGSGVGKTTLVFQMYKALTSFAHNEFLGRKATNKAAWAYVAIDRTERECRQTQRRMGVDFPVFSTVDHDLFGKSLTGEIIPRLPKFYGYRPQFIFVDGFSYLFPGRENVKNDVGGWLEGISRYCFRKKLTILGSCHSPKTKEGHGYSESRHKVAGLVAWAGFCSTIIVLDFVGKPEDGFRDVHICPRNSAEERIPMKFNNQGWLVPRDGDERVLAEFLLAPILNKLPPGEHSYVELWEAGKAKGVSRPTFDRFLRRMVEQGTLTRVKKGTYQKNPQGSLL